MIQVMKSSQKLKLLSKRLNRLDYGLIINTYFIVFISLVFVYSATHSRTLLFFKKEIIWTFMGSITFIYVSLFDYRHLKKYSKLLYTINIVLLIMVYIVGTTRLGATRWISIAGFNFQPSEFAKLFVILTLCDFLVSEYEKGVRGWSGIIKTGLFLLPPFLLIMKQPDLGTSLVLIFIYIVLIFLHGVDMWPFITLMGSGVVMVPIVFKFMLKGYQKSRILVFLNPEKYIKNEGWNMMQSMISVGSGGLFGKGLLNGTQNKLRFLPESHTDFIYSVLSEEVGFVGSVMVLLLYVWLILSVVNIGNKSDDSYGQLICYGIAALLFFHVLVNIGMIIGIMPITGLPLLLMSYGGSSYLFTFIMLGVVQSVKIYGTK